MIYRIHKAGLNLFVLIIMSMLLHGCSTLKHKKNRCNDCPKWNKMELQLKEVSI